MTASQMQMFGGDWTQRKLDMLRQYLSRYTTALKNAPFELVYFDAFAGTGYREAREKEVDGLALFEDLAADEPQRFLDGSARIALNTEPPFQKYVFIEKSASRIAELATLKSAFPGLAGRISLINEDCNGYLQDVCREWDWRGRRAVLFLDPFGMQVDWDTVASVAATQAMDVWVLFPSGLGINRLLKRDGCIPDSWRKRLDRVFGTAEWYNVFYETKASSGLFGEEELTEKSCSIESIAQYYVERMRTVFAKVADKPKPLPDSGKPLFHFCFAVGNPKGAPIALRIANHILGHS